MGFFTIEMLLFTAILFSTTVAANEFCTAFEELRTDSKKFDSYTKSGFFPKEVSENIKICLHGDGDMTVPMGISNEVLGLYTFASDLNTLSSSSYPEASSVQLKDLIDQADQIIKYKKSSNEFIISPSTNESNPFVSLSTLQSWTDNSIPNSLQTQSCGNNKIS